MGKGGKGGGADLDALVETTEKNIDFQKDIANRVLALSAPYNQVGFQSLGNLAVLSGIDAPTLQPNYAGTLDDPRFVPLSHGTVDERIAALGPAPDQYIAGTPGTSDADLVEQANERRKIASNLGPGLLAGWDDPSGRAYNNWFLDTTQAVRNPTAPEQTVNPAYQSYQDQVNAIRAQGDLAAPLSTEQRRQKVLSDFYASPEYNITFQEALKQSDKSIAQAAAARGQLNAAPTFNARGENAASLGNQTYNQFRGNLAQLAGFGTTGLANSTNGLSNAGAQVGSAYNNLANIQGNAAIQQANNRSSGFGSALGAFGSILGGF